MYNPKLLKFFKNAQNDHEHGMNAYYCTGAPIMSSNGHLINFLIKITYDSTCGKSLDLWSLKQYLDSFYGTKIGKTVDDTAKLHRKIIKNDIQNLLGEEAKVQVLACRNFTDQSKMGSFENIFDFINSEDLMDKTLDDFVVSNRYSSAKIKFEVWHIDPIMKSPVFCSLFFQCHSGLEIELESLYYWIKSFRNKQIHKEDLTELLYNKLKDKTKAKKIYLLTRYPKYDGIQSNFLRVTEPQMISTKLRNKGRLFKFELKI